MPMLLISGASGPAPRRRSRRKATRSRIIPSTPASPVAAASARRMGQPSIVTSHQATMPPTAKMLAWARLRMSSTPKTRV